MTRWQSDWLRVRGDGESPFQGAAARSRGTARGEQGRHTKGGHGPLCKERPPQSCQRDERG